MNPTSEEEAKRAREQPIASTKLETYVHKLEYMFLRLGGEDEEMRARNIKWTDKFEDKALQVRNKVKKIWEDIDTWDKNVKLYGKNSKERITADVWLNNDIAECSKLLDEAEAWLEKKRKKFEAEELEQRYTTLDLLWKNVKILNSQISKNSENIEEDSPQDNKRKKLFNEYTNKNKLESSKEIEIEMQEKYQKRYRDWRRTENNE